MNGETVYVGYEAVPNVLVHCGESSAFNSMNAIDITDFVGPYADYILYFPISYKGDLTGKQIRVRGILCDVIGRPDHERPDKVFDGWTGSWDMTVRVRKTLPEQREDIKIIAVVVKRDSLGFRTTEEEVIYDGPAQARQSSAGEGESDAGVEGSLTYYFVTEWLGTLDDYTTQQLFVEYKGKRFNVDAVENIDEKNETSSIRGVWNG